MDERPICRKTLVGSEVIVRGSEHHCYIYFKQSLAQLVYFFHVP